MATKKSSPAGEEIVIEETAPVELVPAEAAPVETRTAEAWAEELGYLPQFQEANRLGVTVGNPLYWKYQAAKALMEAKKTWEAGQQMTRADFEAALTEYDAQRFG